MRRRLPMLLLSCLLAFAAAAAQPAHCPRPVGMVVRSEDPLVTFFNPLSGEVCGELDLAQIDTVPPVAKLGGVAICPLADGRLVAAVGDLESRVHLVDPERPFYLGTVELLINPDDLSCCGDFLVVTPGEVLFPSDPVTVVHLADPESNILELTTVATANACLPGGGSVLVIDDHQELVRLDLHLMAGGGVLDGAATATTLVAHPLADLSVAPAGDCGTVVLDAEMGGLAGGRPAGFDPSMEPTGSLSSVGFPSPETAYAGSCTGSVLAFVRSFNSLVAFERQPGCQLGEARYALAGLQVTAIESNADNFACAAGLLYVTVDRDEQADGVDTVEIRRQSDGVLVTTVDLGGRGEPAWIAVHFDAPAVDVPTLAVPSLALLALLTLSLGLRRLAQRHPARAASRNRR